MPINENRELPDITTWHIDIVRVVSAIAIMPWDDIQSYEVKLIIACRKELKNREKRSKE